MHVGWKVGLAGVLGTPIVFSYTLATVFNIVSAYLIGLLKARGGIFDAVSVGDPGGVYLLLLHMASTRFCGWAVVLSARTCSIPILLWVSREPFVISKELSLHQLRGHLLEAQMLYSISVKEPHISSGHAKDLCFETSF